MRYSPEHKEVTRTRLLKATGALVKEKGFAATGIDGLMAAAELTSGAFYSHFGSKSELLDAIVENELKRSIDLFSNKSLEQGIAAVEGYLSHAHVEHPESGCLVPSLAPEIARSNKATKHKFERGMIGLKDQIQNLVNDDAKAWSIVVQLIGAVMVARGFPTEQTRNELLRGVTQQVKQLLDGESAVTPTSDQ